MGERSCLSLLEEHNKRVGETYVSLVVEERLVWRIIARHARIKIVSDGAEQSASHLPSGQIWYSYTEYLFICEVFYIVFMIVLSSIDFWREAGHAVSFRARPSLLQKRRAMDSFLAMR